MTKDEFERIIVDDEHKQGLLYLVRKGIEEGNLDGEEEEKWYDSCAKLYEESVHDHVNFRINLANRLDSLRYTKYTTRRLLEDDNAKNLAFQRVYTQVVQYANQKDKSYSESDLVHKISQESYRFEIRSQQLKEAVSELEDCKNIIKLSSGSRELYEVRFKTRNGNDYEDFKIHSKKAIELFNSAFLHYFKDRYLEEVDLRTVLNKIDSYKKAQKALLHRLIHEIYSIFVQKGFIAFDSATDTYQLVENRNGKFASLKGEVSVWIFGLLDFMGYLNSLEDKKYMTHKNKVDFIKDRMKQYCKYGKEDILGHNEFIP